jgi:hypothetical protein
MVYKTKSKTKKQNKSNLNKKLTRKLKHKKITRKHRGGWSDDDLLKKLNILTTQINNFNKPVDTNNLKKYNYIKLYNTYITYITEPIKKINTSIDITLDMLFTQILQAYLKIPANKYDKYFTQEQQKHLAEFAKIMNPNNIKQKITLFESETKINPLFSTTNTNTNAALVLPHNNNLHNESRTDSNEYSVPRSVAIPTLKNNNNQKSTSDPNQYTTLSNLQLNNPEVYSDAYNNSEPQYSNLSDINPNPNTTSNYAQIRRGNGTGKIYEYLHNLKNPANNKPVPGYEKVNN